jgi:hypothetical protein
VGFQGASFFQSFESISIAFSRLASIFFWSMSYLNFSWSNEITIGGSEQKKPIDQSLGPPWLQSER